MAAERWEPAPCWCAARPRFNEAAAKWPRKAGSRSDPRGPGWTCFNEAAAKWPRKVGLDYGLGLGLFASMRPRPNGRGKGAIE